MGCVKGDKVEVAVDEGEESHSHPAAWRCAEIISANGDTYTVRYECFLLEMGATVETVSGKAIRPCPPRISPPSSWAQGDVAEVFEEGLWRLAHVSMLLDGEFVYVSCRGSCKELLVHLAKLRVPQIWQDSRWIVIKKESDNCDDEIVKNHSKIKKCILKIPRSRMDVKKSGRNSGFSNVPCADSDKHCPLSRKSMKKRPRHGSPFVNPCDAASGNLKAARKEGGRQERIVSHPSHLMNKGQNWRLEKLAMSKKAVKIPAQAFPKHGGRTSLSFFLICLSEGSVFQIGGWFSLTVLMLRGGVSLGCGQHC